MLRPALDTARQALEALRGAPPLARRHRVALRAAWRTGLYGVGSAVLRRLQPRPTAAQRQVLWAFWHDAFLLHRDMLTRDDVAAALDALERADLRELPAFALALPRDLWRAARKRAGGQVRVRPNDGFAYPAYYLHDFHHQKNGGLSASAASTYEWQIRLLFAGTNRLMRQALIDRIPPGDHLDVLDLGCGTAAWLPQARLLGRGHRVHGVDLSPDYLKVARRHADPAAHFSQANIERPLSGGPYDLVTCIWVYHELPPEARERVTATLVQALKPGGKLLLMDAMQQSDVPERDLGFINGRFAADFDEPYFESYQTLDLEKHLESAGLVVEHRRRVFVSKLIEARRPAAATCR